MLFNEDMGHKLVSMVKLLLQCDSAGAVNWISTDYNIEDSVYVI